MDKWKCKIVRKWSLALVLILPFLLSSCYYDNYDDLVVQGAICDTVSITYSLDIAPIMTTHCTSCHGGSSPAGNIPLEDYSDVKATVDNGSLLGTINHASGWSAMPKNQLKLGECSVNKVSAWINQGAKK